MSTAFNAGPRRRPEAVGEHSAQVVVPYKQEVVGSSPAAPTIDREARRRIRVPVRHNGDAVRGRCLGVLGQRAGCLCAPSFPTLACLPVDPRSHDGAATSGATRGCLRLYGYWSFALVDPRCDEHEGARRGDRSAREPRVAHLARRGLVPIAKTESVRDVRRPRRPDGEGNTDCEEPGSDQHAGAKCHDFRMLTARAITSTTVITEIADWVSIVSFAQRVMGMTSVGLNAIAFVDDT